MMFVELDGGELRKLVSEAIKKAGSERKLSKATSIPVITIYYYKNEAYNISEKRYYGLAQFLGIPNELAKQKIRGLLPDDWGRVKGGKESVRAKKKNGTWESNFAKMKEGSSKKLKAWHKKMKREQPEAYYNIQYDHFKKIGKYKFITMRHEKVRNILEKDVADLLYEMGLDYKYEPLVKGKENFYFPDFKINSLLIECSMWRGKEKAYKLLHKIKDLEKAGYTAIVIVPAKLRHFYKALDTYLLTDLAELKEKLTCPGSSVTS